jgi:Holliday junction resolvasome RuvABC endonuclease subunit
MKSIRIAGVDPSLRNTGLALAEVNLGTGEIAYKQVSLVQTKPADKAKMQRQNSADLVSCRELHRGVHKVIDEWQPHFITAELPTGGMDNRAVFGFGVVHMLMATMSRPIIEVTPKEVKAATGVPRASKAEMIAWAVKQAPDINWNKRKLKGNLVLVANNEHMADACAVIAAAVETTQFLQVMSLYRAQAA